VVLKMHRTTGRSQLLEIAPDVQSLLGSQLHAIVSIDQPSSPHIAADASVDRFPLGSIASFIAPACTDRRLRDSGAHTTRHVIAQSTGTVQAL
jgi:hypothetical protein